MDSEEASQGKGDVDETEKENGVNTDFHLRAHVEFVKNQEWQNKYCEIDCELEATTMVKLGVLTSKRSNKM